MTSRALACVLALTAGCRTPSAIQGNDSLVAEAQKLLSEGQVSRAIERLNSERTRTPHDFSVIRVLVAAHRQGGTLATFMSTLPARHDAPTHYARGLALFAGTARVDDAVAGEFQAALSVAPEEGELHHRWGLLLLESERFDEAITPLKRAVELAPRQFSYCLPLARALHRAGHPQEARAALLRLVDVDAAGTDIAHAALLMNELTDSLVRVPASAHKAIEEALRLLNNANAPEAAIVALEELLHAYPGLAGGHVLLGLAFQRTNDASRAVDSFRHASALNPDDALPHLYLGELYSSRGKREAAKASFEEAATRNPFLPIPPWRLGEVALDAKDLVAAERWFHRWARILPDEPAPRAKWALVLQLMGRFRDAELALLASHAAQPENPEYMLRLGLLFVDERLKAKTATAKREAETAAVKWLSATLAKDPENADASRALDSVRTP